MNSPFNTLIQRFLSSENADIGLHDLLHGASNLVGTLGAVSGSDLVNDVDRLSTSVSRHLGVLLARVKVIPDGVADSTTENNQIKERVGTETVRTVDGHTCGLTACEETWNNLVVALGVLSKDLTSVLGRDTTHVVVDGWQDGDWLLADVDTSEDGGGLRDTWKTVVEDLRWQVRELQVNVVLVWANTTALADLHGHGTRDNVTGGKILGSWSVTLHEPLTLRVQEVTTLTTRALSDQAASTIDTSWVELHKLQILIGKTSTSNHCHTVTSASVSGCAREVGTTVTTGSEDSVVGAETVKGTVLLVVGDDTLQTVSF